MRHPAADPLAPQPPRAAGRGRAALRFRLLTCLLALGSGASNLPPAVAQVAAGSDDRQTRVFVRFSPASAGWREAALAAGGDWVRQRGGVVHHVFPEQRSIAVSVSARDIEALRRQPGVEWVEREPMRRTFAPAKPQVTPSLSNGLYGLVTTRMIEAQQAKVAGQGILVGVADSGLDCGHPDIAPALLDAVNVVGQATNSSPCVGSATGIDPAEVHGTHVAGTIVAANNNVGLVGGAPLASLVYARVCFGGGQSRCPASDVMQGVTWLADRGARIINLSLGGEDSSVVEQDFYRRMRERGVLVVASSGNDAAAVGFPAAYPEVVAVGAVDAFDQLASFSNRGPELDLVAPGVNVLSTVPRGQGSEAGVKATAKNNYPAIGMTFAGATAAKGLTRKLVFCGLGRPEEIPPTVKGQIALIQRGELLFAEKVAHAMAAGAAGVVVFNNASGLFSGTLGNEVSPSGAAWIPAVGISAEAGAWLLANRANKPATLLNAAADYDLLSGTSMATPHVVAAAALVWSVRPDLDAAGVLERLQATALDLGAPGPDPSFGAGRIDAFRAALE